MRKILFLLAMLPMLMFSACSDDDDEVKITSEQVTGKWNVTWVQEGSAKFLIISKGNIYMELRSDGFLQDCNIRRLLHWKMET